MKANVCVLYRSSTTAETSVISIYIMVLVIFYQGEAAGENLFPWGNMTLSNTATLFKTSTRTFLYLPYKNEIQIQTQKGLLTFYSNFLTSLLHPNFLNFSIRMKFTLSVTFYLLL